MTKIKNKNLFDEFNEIQKNCDRYMSILVELAELSKPYSGDKDGNAILKIQHANSKYRNAISDPTMFNSENVKKFNTYHQFTF